MNFTTIIFYLLIDQENHRHDVLERRRIGVEIGPEVVLQILTHLQNHHPLQRHGLSPSFDQQLRLVNLLHQLRIEPLLTAGVFTSSSTSSGSFRPVILRDLREPVPLDLQQRNRARQRRLHRLIRRRLRRDDVGSTGYSATLCRLKSFAPVPYTFVIASNSREESRGF